MRTKYSLLNMAVSVGAQLINIVLLFFSRKIFLQYFTEEYLGVNGLFTELLTVLSLAELGIATAMMYGLYEAVAKDDQTEICRMMNLYRRLYTIVGCIVIAVGLSLLPFLDYFIKDNNIPHIRLIFLLYLSDSAVSYFLSYKQTIIQASQKGFIVTGTAQMVRCLQIILQIVSVVVFQNFYLYIAIQIAGQICSNVILALISHRLYPFLRRNKAGLPDKEKISGIYRHIRAMALHKFGAVFVSNTDNLIISSFIGLGTVGIYSNYKMVINSLRLFFSYIYNAFTASIGNLAATDEAKRVGQIYNGLNFMMSVLYGWAAMCLFLMINPFISIFFGEQFCLSMWVVAIISADFYIHGMRQMTLRFREGMGLFWYDRYKPVFEVLINLVVSLLLVKPYGIAGVVAGTIVSSLLTNFWVEPYILFRHGIKDNWKHRLGGYFLRYGKYTAVMLLSIFLSAKLMNVIPHDNFIGLLLCGILISVVYAVVSLLVYARSEEFRFITGKIVPFFARLKQKHQAEDTSSPTTKT